MNRIPEEYIHYLWQYGLFSRKGLKTDGGESIEIIHQGLPNTDAGPDFSQSRIRINGREWFGSVEIHFRSSDWKGHGHHLDRAYDNVILHVVIEHDQEVKNGHGVILPTLVLKPYLEAGHFEQYQRFINSKYWIACENQITSIDSFKWVALKERMALTRLHEKSESVIEKMKELNGDWEEVAYQLLCKVMGAKVNALPFEQLSLRTPLKLIRKYKKDRLRLESLFLGQAGFLSLDELFADDHSIELSKEYQFLVLKHSLRPMSKVAWKNARIRPSSAPQIRVVQLSRLMQKVEALFSIILSGSKAELDKLFKITLTGYWSSHIGLGRSSSARSKSIGTSLRDRIFINAIAPLRFAYGLYTDDNNYRESAISLLEEIKPEDNQIIRKWSDRNVEVGNAMDSQALLQLKASFCDKKKCLECSIGQELLRKNE